MSLPHLPQLLTAKDVCDVLRVHRCTLYRLIERGEFAPPLKIGSTSRWRTADVEAYVSGARKPKLQTEETPA